jgi:hypothetical protein
MKKEGRRFVLTSRFRDIYARTQIDERMKDADFKRIKATGSGSGEVMMVWGGKIDSKRDSTRIAKHLRDASHLIRDQSLKAGLLRFQIILTRIIGNNRYSLDEKAFAIVQAQAILESELEQMGKIPMDRLGASLRGFIKKLLSSDGCQIVERLGLRNRVRSHIRQIRDKATPELDSFVMAGIIRKLSEPMNDLRKRPVAAIMIPMYYDSKVGKP